MDAFTYAVNHVKHTVPKSILESVFLTGKHFDIVTAIKKEVYVDRVLTDLGLAGYTITNIRADLANVTSLSPTRMVLQYPEQILDHREIIACYGLYDLGRMGGIRGGGTEAFMDETITQSMPSVVNIHTRVQGKNTILIERDHSGIYANIPSSVLRVDMLDHSDLNTLTPHTLRTFSFILKAAVEAYVYNNSLVKGKLATQFGGAQPTAIDERISEYSGAEEEYQRLLEEEWGKTTLFEDGHTHEELIRMQLTGISRI